jgi:hypothetical protein
MVRHRHEAPATSIPLRARIRSVTSMLAMSLLAAVGYGLLRLRRAHRSRAGLLVSLGLGD